MLAYMVVDSYYLLKRSAFMPPARFYTVMMHHFVTFIMQPVSFFWGYWQYYGNLIVVIAESTSLLSNLNVLLPDLGYPRHTTVFRINTVIFAVVFILCRCGGLTYVYTKQIVVQVVPTAVSVNAVSVICADVCVGG